MEFTGKAFHVHGLNLEQWLWCLFLGFLELLWGQIVLCIPKNSFPKLCRFGSGTPNLPSILEPDGPKDNRARLLWLRGLTRLQHQVGYRLFSAAFGHLLLTNIYLFCINFNVGF